MISTTIRKGKEILSIAFNVRVWSNVARIQKVPYTEIMTHLSGQREGSEGTEVDRNICLVYCGIEEGFRLAHKPCPYTIDDIWDWLMEDGPEFENALNAIQSAIIASVQQIEGAVEVTDSKKK